MVVLYLSWEKFGGEYSGNNYIGLRDEIIELSNGKIENPSISLMEYYLSVKMGISHYVFVNKEYDDEEKRKKHGTKGLNISIIL